MVYNRRRRHFCRTAPGLRGGIFGLLLGDDGVAVGAVLRQVGFEFCSKLADPRWRKTWDWGLFAGSAVPALIFGVAFGNLLQGVPFHFDEQLVPHYTGSFFGLLNPFALLTGAVSVAAMLVFHGAI